MLVDDTPARVLAVYAHPDDAEVVCGGTLARWAGAGAEVHLVVCCQGDKGTSDPAAEPAALAARRRREAEEAAGVLGVRDAHFLGHPDGELDDGPVLRAELVNLIRRCRPELVLCPDPTSLLFGAAYVNHRDHRAAGYATLDAVAPAARMPLYFPEQGPPHAVREVWLSGTPDTDVHVDIATVVDVKAAALACHASQVGHHAEFVEEVVRSRAEEAGAEIGVLYAESFRRLRLL